MKLTRRRALNLPKHRLGRLAYNRQQVSFFIVITFFVIFSVIFLAEVLFMDVSRSGVMGRSRGADDAYDEDDEGGVWETPQPLVEMVDQRQVYVNRQRLVDGGTFKDKIRARQVEMEQLIKNISESMKSNPLVKQIQKGRERSKFTYTEVGRKSLFFSLRKLERNCRLAGPLYFRPGSLATGTTANWFIKGMDGAGERSVFKAFNVQVPCFLNRELPPSTTKPLCFKRKKHMGRNQSQFLSPYHSVSLDCFNAKTSAII